MDEGIVYEVSITGGGLAGLALGIQCARAGFKTILFEKERYPFHRVCGEYISFESWNFLEDLGVPLSKMDLPAIRRVLITAPNGKSLEEPLPLGGFGISRYMLDAMLADLARQCGVEIYEGTKVEEIELKGDLFNLHMQVNGQKRTIRAQVAAGAFGKRSNLDVKWGRSFVAEKPSKLYNYLGVKYHVRTPWPEDLIALHNFKNGYCGISRVEKKVCCLCYLTSAKNLYDSGNSVAAMERQILQVNPQLKRIFLESERLIESPVTISQISFARKELVVDHVLMIGDAAGMITPLCGNGMSMALHGSKLAFAQISEFLQHKCSRDQMERGYTQDWGREFGKRLRTGRLIQRFFGSPALSNLLISTLKPFPAVTRKLISLTHGQPF